MSGDAAYFQSLDKALKTAGIYQPVLILDLDRLDQNIDTMLSHLPNGMGYRIVAKSLPVPRLLEHIRARSGTDRLMTFNLPMLLALSQSMPNANQLLGKPLPAAAFRDFLDSTSCEEAERVHWLIDTRERLEAYGEVAQAAGTSVNIVLELDVGLHRGGFETGESLRASLNQLKQSNVLRFKGFMGYEPHLASIPKTLGWRDRAKKGAWDAYGAAFDMAREIFSDAELDELIRNTAGSPTYRLYQDTKIGNEVSVGSALVKPTHFDTELLEPFVPACFIATPCLKAVGATRLPALEFADSVKRMVSPETAQSFFIHGGNWLASPEYPAGLRYNKTFGRSSNQEMLNGPSDLDLKPDDFVFLRPHQSEAIFLQFGDLAIVRNGALIDRWPTFAVSA